LFAGNVTASWQAQVSGSAGRTNDGVRTVVFEENGEPGWQAGLNIHNLARGAEQTTTAYLLLLQ